MKLPDLYLYIGSIGMVLSAVTIGYYSYYPKKPNFPIFSYHNEKYDRNYLN
jgi:hypothetical protein